SGHNNQINVKVLSSFVDHFRRPSRFHHQLMSHLHQIFSRGPLELEHASFRRNRDIVSEFSGITQRDELSVQQVHQRMIFASEPRRLAKRCHRAITEVYWAENSTKYC